MKLLCEVPLTEVKTFQESNFDWLAKSSSDNLLFTFENGKQMRVFAIKNKNALHKDKQAARAHEAQSAALAEPRRCTSSSWNRDQSLLTLVVDRRQIYFWEVHRNTFVQFKPKYLMQELQFAAGDEVLVSGRRRTPGKYIDHIAWSKTSDKLSICLSDGQILLCNVVANSGRNYVSSWEHLIGNSEGLLKRIKSIHASDHADLFVCCSVSNELLVMAFDGANRLYFQGEGEGHRPYNMKFSPPIREFDARLGAYCEDRLWLAHQSDFDSSLIVRSILLKKSASSQAREDLASSRLAVLIQDQIASNDSSRTPCSLIDFYWLNSMRLIACLSNGSIQLLYIKDSSQMLVSLSDTTSPSVPLSVTKREVLCLKSSELENESDQIGNEEGALKAFELIRSGRKEEDSSYRQSFAFAALTSHRLHYYEIYENRNTFEDGEEFAFEHLDDLDLSEALGRINLKFERLKWSQDCSMLSIQLSSGHLLIYQTQLLHDHMVASYGAKTAYLSSLGEITLLNYGSDGVSKLAPSEVESSDGGRNSVSSSRTGTPQGGNAIILSLPFNPSLLAIGPKHLAVALNNRVRFYTIETILMLNNQITTDNHRSLQTKRRDFAEQEYVTLVVGIGLSSRFVATMLDDGRVKLHSLNQLGSETQTDSVAGSAFDGSSVSNDELNDELIDDERFFPDPGQTTHRISAFALTEELLVYCTVDSQIYVFSLKYWQTVQTYNHSSSFRVPVIRLKPNDRGNKFICLLKITYQRPNSTSSSSELADTDPNVYLYDLFSNTIFNLDCNESKLANQMSRKLLTGLVDKLPSELASSDMISRIDGRAPTLSRIRDVVWDTDGRTVLFIQTNSIHVVAILEHTLEQEKPLAIYADSAKKPASHSTLYVSEGIVSYQTSLGRVINSILDTHDDELKLTRLEHRIKLINDRYAITKREGKPTDPLLLQGHLKVLLLKLEYLRSILPIYSLPKCRDICEHLMDEEAFKFRPQTTAVNQSSSWAGQIDQLIWRLLAGWAIFTQNLNFAHQIFQQHCLNEPATVLDDLFERMKASGLNSRSTINEKLLELLELL